MKKRVILIWRESHILQKKRGGYFAPSLYSMDDYVELTCYTASGFLFFGTPGIQEINLRHSWFSQTTNSALALQIEL